MADVNVAATTEWIRFFRDAGLPANVAANYAIVFTENRIQRNMLMDLTKEYLFDMGIKVMGDVIAILKYAKEYHNKLAEKKVMEDVSPKNTNSPPRRNSTVMRILGHYSRPISYPSDPTSPQHLEQKVHQRLQIPSIKRRLDTSDSPIKRIRKVPPEEEGAYKIKMPVGNTERSRKLLQQQRKLYQGKGSVFNRLGDSIVSSSTDVSGGKSTSVFSRLGPSGNYSNEVSTSSEDEQRKTGETDKCPLQYRGVLKKAVSQVEGKIIRLTKSTNAALGKINAEKRKKLIITRQKSRPLLIKTTGTRTVLNPSDVQIKKISSTRFTVPEKSQRGSQSQGIFSKNRALFTNPPVKSRLGSRIISLKSSINSPQNAKVADVKGRLGKINVSRTIFQRLGQ